MPRTWVNDAAPYLNAANLNDLEAELLTALWSAAALSTKTANYTATSTDKVLVFNGSNLTATLPDPTTVSGRIYRIKNIHSSALVLNSAGTSKTLDGVAYRMVQPYQHVEVVSDGTQWLLLTNGITGVAPSVRAFATNYNNASNSITVTIPATAVAGDLLVAFVGSNYAVSAVPAGWSLRSLTSASFHNGALATKVCLPADIGATVSFTLSGSEPVNIACLVIQSAASTPVGYSVTQNTTGISIATAGALAQNNDLALIFGSQRLAAQTINSTIGTVVTRRTADASLSSAVFSYAVTASGAVSPTLSSASSGSGWGEGVLILRGV
jgi:hypothetical protein